MDRARNTLYQRIADLSAQCGAEKVVLFGSRARGDFTRTSDIDLAIYGMPRENQGRFWWEMEELPTLLKFDIVHIISGMDSDFLKNIEQDGVTLYEKSQ